MKKLLLIFLLCDLTVSGQNTFATSLSYSRTDFFHGVEYGRGFNSWNVLAGFEYGIVRSVFQSRFFPKVKAGIFYSALQKEKFRLGPVVQYSYAYLRYSKVPEGETHYHELNAGLRWRYGKKWQIGQTLLVGGLWEQGMNHIYKKTMVSGTWGYVIQMECIYAF